MIEQTALAFAPYAAGQRIGVIIVTYNSKAFWPRLAASLSSQTLRDFQVLIVDNASEPEQRLHASNLPENAAYVQLDNNVGFAAANNLAAHRLECEYLALLNPDAFPEPEWLERLAAAAERHPEAAAFGSTQKRADKDGVIDGLGDCFWAGGHAFRAGYGRTDALPVSGETFSACGAAALYRRRAFLALGGFDERFFSYSEDVDLGFRLRLAGGKTIQVSDAIVHHIGGASAGRRSPFKTYHAARNRIWTFVKNMPGPLFWLLLPIHAALNLSALAHAAAIGALPDTWRGVRDALTGLPAVLQARRAVQQSRIASIGSIAGALTWSPLAVAARRPKIWGAAKP